MGYFAVPLFLLALYFAISVIGKSNANAKADQAVPQRATVIRIMPGENSSQVLFEKENGDKVNLSVPVTSCTFVEGDTGMLKADAGVFRSFTKSEEEPEQNA